MRDCVDMISFEKGSSVFAFTRMCRKRGSIIAITFYCVIQSKNKYLISVHINPTDTVLHDTLDNFYS